MITAIRAEAGRGWGWIVEGWQLFAKAPGVWVVMSLIYFGINTVLFAIPFIGSLAQAVLTPVLVGGMLFGVAAQERGATLQLGYLFRGFQDQERIGPLVMLGLINLAGNVLVGLVLFVFIIANSIFAGVTLDSVEAIMSSEMMVGLFGIGLTVFLLIELGILLLILMGLFYGIPLVMLGKQNTWPAFQASIAACWINTLPFLVSGLILTVLLVVAIIPLGVGLLVWWPVVICTIYASYRDVFEELSPPAGIRMAM